MKILIIDNSVGITGALKAILDTIDPLKKEHEFIFAVQDNQEVTNYIASKGYKSYPLHFIEISRNPFKNFSYPFKLIQNSIKLSQLIKNQKIDIVQVNDLYNLSGVFTKLFCTFKLVTHVRRMPDSFPIYIYKFWCKIHLKFSDKILPVSKANARIFGENKKVEVLYDPIILDARSFAYQSNNDKCLKILYLANYTRGKGQNHIIHILHEHIEALTIKNFKIHFVGSDFELNNNILYKNELIKMVDDYGLQNYFEFNGPSSNIYNEIVNSDIMLNLSDSESLSRVTMEALYYGVPIIATNVGGTNEMIHDQLNGIIVEKNDYFNTFQKLKWLIENPLERNKLTQHKNLTLAKFDPLMISEQLNIIYKC